ncbi:MAG: SMP-30/gluconolactonase/LRE family protein [Chloroflexi bacterium]|nr:SMP-30/gluconolactonase/LRE family protein [Chloroflexota bacterium]MCI0769369.1 SMP-30/gluconolactonase/LRE family protein [Chloroflexota bacterium]
MATLTPTPLLDGLVFPEGPRWRDGKLWFSDMHAHKVMTVDLQGRTEDVATVPQRPSGLGFLPDGRMLVVSMLDKRLLRLDPGGLTTVADLAGLCDGDANDMVVDSQGRAYVGYLGFEMGEEFKLASIVMVEPDGSARVVADELSIPNGAVITPDGKTMIVAESRGNRLTAFDIETDGSLSGRRVFAEVGDAVPDGICLDAETGVWVGSPTTSEFFRVLEGGEITHRIPTPGRYAVACIHGGEDRRTLFLLTAETTGEDLRRGISKGWIETVQVDVPGAGWP